MRTIKFTMTAEIDIDDDTFTQSMTDIDKVRFDVVRGYTTLRVKEIKLHRLADPMNEDCNLNLHQD